MERMFLITASNRVRIESRILQVLDHHMVPVESFSSMRLGDEARVTFMAKLDDDGACRTCDMLRRLQDVHSIDCFAYQDGFCRTLAMFRILCDQESRLPLLQVISSMGAQVVAVRPDWVAFQMIGSSQDIEGLRASLLPYGRVRRGNLRGFDRRAKPPQPDIATRPRAIDRRAQDSQQFRRSFIGECLPGV